ncbi:hypothetical protein ACLB2K_077283 [Fragaria x ananassa]
MTLTRSMSTKVTDSSSIFRIERARKMSAVKSAVKYSLDKNKPDCILKLVKNQPLAKSSCKDKEAHQFEFKFGSSAIKYEVSDVLEILPSQNPAAVDAFTSL